MNFASAIVDVLVKGNGLHLCIVCASHSLSDLVLLFIELDLDQELGEHDIDPSKSDVRVSQLVLDVQSVPYIANNSVVLDDSAQCLVHICKQCPRMNTLLGLDA